MISFSITGDNRSIKVKKNIVGSFLVKGLSILISLILVPLTIGYVNNELYGIWLTLATIISWVTLFDMGFGNGLKNKVAECVALDDWEKARRYISTAYVYFFVIFALVSLFIYWGCSFIDWTALLNVPDEYLPLLIKVMRIVIIFFCISMVVKVQNTVLDALQMNALSAAINATGQFLLLIVTVLLTIMTKPSLVYLAIAISVSPLVVNIVASIWMYGYKYRRLRPSLSLADKRMVKDVINLGLNFFILQIAALILYQTINVIISYIAGPESVTEYNVVFKYISIPMMVMSIVTAPFWAAFTDAYTTKDFEWMRRVYHKLLICYMGFIGVLIVLLMISPIAFKLWLGDKVIIHPSMCIAVTFYVSIMMWNNLHSTLINGIGLVKLQLYSCVVSTVLNIPLALLFGRLFGAYGVVTSVTALSIPGLFIMYIQINKILNNSAQGLWAK